MNKDTYKKSQLKWLCCLVGSNIREINYIFNNIDQYYREWKEPKIDGKTGLQKLYKDGSPKLRIITPPQGRLKEIQKKIKNKILQQIPLPNNIQGGVKKKNNITNAKLHQGHKYQLTIDLDNFFPSISSKVVYRVFLNIGYSNLMAEWLTKLTTWKGKLPQGCPTSTHIANLAFLNVDKALINISKENQLTYTRYVDDLTFSSPTDFRSIADSILAKVKSGGFKINYRKTKYGTFQTITGLHVFNNYIDAPERIKMKAKQESLEGLLIKPYTNYLSMVAKANNKINQR